MTGPRRSETPRVLYVAAGGGGDPIACAMIARHFDPDIERPLIASMSWDRLILDPVPGPRVPADFIGLEPIGRLNYRVTGATTLRPPAASSLPRLSRELPADVYLLDPHRGAPGMAAQLGELADLLALDAIRLVDVGGDVVARGDEPGLRSPLADALSLAAVANVAPDSRVFVAGPGLDGELSAEEVVGRCRILGGQPVATLDDQAVALLQAIFAWHPSEASGLLWAAASGARGSVEIRDHRRLVTLDRKATELWCLSAETVCRGGAASAGVRHQQTLRSAVDALEAAGMEVESRYESEKARAASDWTFLVAERPQPCDQTLATGLRQLRDAAKDARVDYFTSRALHDRLGCEWPSPGLLALAGADGGRLFPPLWPVESARTAFRGAALDYSVDPAQHYSEPEPCSTDENLDGVIRLAVEAVLRRHPGWAEGGPYPGCLSQCAIASRELVGEFAGHGVDSEIVWLVGPRGDLERAHPRAFQSPEHAVVLVRGRVVDITRPQWDSESAWIAYDCLADAGRHWEAYYPDGGARLAAPVSLHRPPEL